MHIEKALPAAVALLLLYLLLSPAVQGQAMPSFVVYGLVTDEAGNPVAGASVTLSNQRTGGTATVTAEADGQYHGDLSSLQGGYQQGDIINVKVKFGNLEGISTTTVIPGPGNRCDIVVTEESRLNPTVMMAIIIIPVATILASAMFLNRKGPGEGEEKSRRRR